ncbi:hypothetical protein INT47_011172 [Mucor saturninus]|uniref:Ubiquitin-like domain-containing protein n=1 Tax=Mucor saturninus TaxID=64648 RepID=A0A8H7VDZ9_9FUNG|nr:hypothetical protein INT47_011172 [Mucor saturninus]
MDVIALSIKSLEQQTKSVTLPRSASVLELKQKIQLEFDIDGTRQRLIFQGKVLRDGKNLSDYDNLDDGKVIHLVVRPIGVAHNPENDEPSRNSQRRTSTRHEGYAVITLDATLSDLEDGNSLMSTIMNSLLPQGGDTSPRLGRATGLLHALRAARTESSRRRAPPIDLMEDARTSSITLPVPSSVEMRLSRTMSYIREIRTLLNTPIVESDTTNRSTRHASIGAIRESRELLRQEENHAGQVGLVVEELADLMYLLIPWLREMGHSLRTEENGRTSSQQLAHVLRTARIVQILSLIHHFLGSVLATAELQPSPSTTATSATTTNVPETWSPIQRPPPPPPPSTGSSSSSPASSSKRKQSEDPSSSSSSQQQQKKTRE